MIVFEINQYSHSWLIKISTIQGNYNKILFFYSSKITIGVNMCNILNREGGHFDYIICKWSKSYIWIIFVIFLEGFQYFTAPSSSMIMTTKHILTLHDGTFLGLVNCPSCEISRSMSTCLTFLFVCCTIGFFLTILVHKSRFVFSSNYPASLLEHQIEWWIVFL